MSQPARPYTILIAALGGEGGGVLADWLIEAARHEGLTVQGTSIPGVSQRTGATTYYLELHPRQPDGREPVMALAPLPGGVDMVVASELVEAGRALQNAFVTPDRTVLIASTHRVYATAEKMPPGDGRFDSGRIGAAARELAQRAILIDMARLAEEAGSVINAVLFGAMAGSGALPLPRVACEAAMNEVARGGAASARGFALGFDAARTGARGSTPRAPRATASALAAPGLAAREFPASLHRVLELAVARLRDYQDAAYAEQFLGRVVRVLELDRRLGGEEHDFRLSSEAARLLALWMCYEDIVRVADLKTRASRFARVRAGVRAGAGQPLVIIDYLKPGVDEVADLVPRWLAQRLRAWQDARGAPLAFALRLKTSSIAGYSLLRSLAWLKPWRRRSARFKSEQEAIERWLAAIERVGGRTRDAAAVMEVVQCARLHKGYGDTLRRGRQCFDDICVRLLENDAALGQDAERFRQQVHAARSAAGLAFADGQGAVPPAEEPPAAAAAARAPAKPVVWLKAG